MQRPVIMVRGEMLGIRSRRVVRGIARDLSPRLLRDIGLEPEAEAPHIPQFVALVTRV